MYFEYPITFADTMLNSTNINDLLKQTLASVKIQAVDFEAPPLRTSAILTKSNGSMVSFASFIVTDDAEGEDTQSLNNIKMMSLLAKDKWQEDEVTEDSNSKSNVRTFEVKFNEKDYKTRIYTYEIEELHTAVAQIPESDLLIFFIAPSNYPYGLLVLKMQEALKVSRDLFGYKLG